MYGYTCASECDQADYARSLAHWAKVELLKEKVKQRMDDKYGPQLDKIADLVTEVVVESAKNVGQLERKEEELEDAWDEFGSGGN